MSAASAAPAVPRPFEIHVNAAARTITPRGELDMATAPNLLAAAQTYMTKTPGDLIIDLAAVTFGDSSLLIAIGEIEAAAREHDGEVMVINASARLTRLFFVCGMNEMVDRSNLAKKWDLHRMHLLEPVPLERPELAVDGARRCR